MVIQARQNKEELDKELEEYVALKLEEKKQNPPTENDYTPESRTKMY